MSKLFSKKKIGSIELKNRIIIPPMCQYSASNGQATEWHLMHYGNLAVSSAGLLIVEATAVSPEGRISYADLGIWDKNTAHALAKVVDFIRLQSRMPLAIQLAHAGRKASTDLTWKSNDFIPTNSPNGWQTVAPSAIAQSSGGTIPKELTKEQIKTIIQQFVDAAKRAVSIGFDMIEIHAAHGYLLHQFLSPISNKRKDEYGGSLENRMRLVLEIFDAIKQEVPKEFPVCVRISATDWIKDGWDLEQSCTLAKELDKRGCGYIHVSSGGIDPTQQLPKLEVGYQLSFAEAIKKEVKMPVIGVGLITEPIDAEKVITDNKADFIAIGRGMLYDPRWVWHAAAELGAQTIAPVQYRRCQPHQYKNLFME